MESKKISNEEELYNYLQSSKGKEKSSRKQQSTKFGDTPRATADPPIVYSKTKAHPINQATLEKIHS